MSAKWSGDASRKIKEWVIVEGVIELVSEAHFGNGEEAEGMDMPLLYEDWQAKDIRAVIPGSGLAGALRNYLKGLGEDAEPLLGPDRSSNDIKQSPLIVEDALSAAAPMVSDWSGNKMDPASGTTADGLLFNFETWNAGTDFAVRLELPILEGQVEEKLLRLLTTCLAGLHPGDHGITLGARGQRGFGRVQGKNWRKRALDVSDKKGFADYIEFRLRDRWPIAAAGDDWNQLSVGVPQDTKLFKIDAEFWVIGGIMFGASEEPASGADHGHLRRYRGKKKVPIAPATSWANTLAAHADRLVRTSDANAGSGRTAKVAEMFGSTGAKSRVKASMGTIEGGTDNLVLAGIQVDRLTQGVLGGKLFAYQPVLSDLTKQDKAATLRLQLSLIDATPEEIGLLLACFRDLSLGILPLGGLVGKGFGTLRPRKICMMKNGEKSTIEFKDPAHPYDPLEVKEASCETS